MHPRPRRHLLAISPYKLPETQVPGASRVLHLASNESAVPPSPAAVDAYRRAAGDLRFYPDGPATGLREAIAAHEGLDPNRIVCGAGSMELLSLIASVYLEPGAEAIHSRYGYLYFQTATRLAGAVPVAAPERDVEGDVDAILGRVTPATRVVFLANPNNPTGSLVPPGEVERLRRELRPDVLLILDAAYAEFVAAPDYQPGARLVEAAGDNTVMLRTFSKIHGLAALRVGWAYCPLPVADMLNRVRGPNNVCAAAQAAAIAALSDTAHVAQYFEQNARLRRWFTGEARALGLAPHDSEGNFVLIRFNRGADRSAAATWEHLKRQGILVRPMDEYGLDDCLRFTIGTEDEMRATAAALRAFLV